MAARPIHGRVVAISGGARGIGRATALALAAHGARVAIGDLDADAVRRTATELGRGVLGLPLDVTDGASFERFLDTVEEALGPLEVMVNNAGILYPGRFLDEDDAQTRAQLAVNLHGPILGSRAALCRMLASRRRCHLVNVASSAGRIAPPGAATYAATKHGLVGFTDVLRAEHRGDPIDFSVVMPATVQTEMTRGYVATPTAELRPEDVAAEILRALRHPHFEVYVPRSLSTTVVMYHLMPRRLRDLLMDLLRGDQAMDVVDPAARAAYEARAAASAPRA